MRVIIAQKSKIESKKIQSTTHAMRANKAMDVEATGLRYYKKCGLVKVRAQCIHATCWRPLSQNTWSSNLIESAATQVLQNQSANECAREKKNAPRMQKRGSQNRPKKQARQADAHVHSHKDAVSINGLASCTKKSNKNCARCSEI